MGTEISPPGRPLTATSFNGQSNPTSLSKIETEKHVGNMRAGRAGEDEIQRLYVSQRKPPAVPVRRHATVSSVLKVTDIMQRHIIFCVPGDPGQPAVFRKPLCCSVSLHRRPPLQNIIPQPASVTLTTDPVMMPSNACGSSCPSPGVQAMEVSPFRRWAAIHRSRLKRYRSPGRPLRAMTIPVSERSLSHTENRQPSGRMIRNTRCALTCLTKAIAFPGPGKGLPEQVLRSVQAFGGCHRIHTASLSPGYRMADLPRGSANLHTRSDARKGE